VLSVIVPTLDEASVLPALLADLQPLRAGGAELIVCDGGSGDGTAEIAAPIADRVVLAPRGRAAQLNAGARIARGDLLVFLHADTRVSAPCVQALAALSPALGWGFFGLRLRGRSRLLPLVAALMRVRSRLTAIGTGDQGLFVSRALFEAVGGYPQQALMEDIEICRRLRRHAPPFLPAPLLESSGRRWDRDGALRTILLMWSLRLRYFLGADPAALARAYHGR
jgi:rSAM/selenodomain-associated transferase 2